MTCETGKTSYPSGPKARAALDSIRKRPYGPGDGKRPIRAYACQLCGKWHLTSDPR